MQKETYTRFHFKAIFIFWFLILNISFNALSQTVTAIPELCDSGPIIDLYDYVDPDGGSFAIITGSTPGLSGHFFDPSAAGAGSYIIRWTHSHVSPGHIDLPITIVSPPTDPTAITSVPDKFCMDQGGNIELTITGGSGTTLHWYDDFPGGNEVGTGSPLVLAAPTISTTYYAVWENACGISLDYNYQVIVYQVSAADMAITGLSSPYCSDAMDDFVNGEPTWGYLDKDFTFAGPGPGFTDNGNGAGVIHPSSIPNGTYDLTYTVSKDNCVHTITSKVTILPPLNISFSGLVSPVCIDGASQLLLGSHAPGGSFSGPGITDNGNGTAMFDPGAAGGGTHTITYTFTDANGCFDTTTQTVEVNNLPALSFGPLAPHYCIGDPIVHIIGSEAPGGSFTINGNPGPLSYFIDNGDGTADFDPTDAGVGVYTIEYSFVDLNNCNNVVAQTTEVHPLPIITLTGPTNICEGTLNSTYITEAGMSNYDWQISGGGVVVNGGGFNDNFITINWIGTGMQSVSVNYEDANGCSALSPTVLNVMIHSLPNVTFLPLRDVCLSDAPFNLTGGAPWGGTYSGPGVIAGVFDPAAAGVGTHTISYTYTGVAGCVNSADQTIVVQDITAQMFGLLPIYCELEADETIFTDHVGDAFGSFSISPMPTNAALFTDNGNSTATFSPNNCDPSDYNIVFTITYTYDNGICVATDQASTEVYGRPVVSFTGLNSLYCTNDGIDLLTGTPANGIFTSTGNGLSDNGNGTAQFDPSVAGATGSPYTITYTFSDAGGCFNSEDQIIEVYEAPIPVLISSDADNIICAGESITFTASGGDTYEFFIDGNSVQGPNSNDTYTTTSMVNGETVTVEVSHSSNGCTALSMGLPITVNNSPTPSFLSGDGLVCESDSSLIYETQAGMSNYVWSITGGNITAGGTSSDHTATVTWTTPGMQSISVNYENANGCSAASPTILNVNVDALPNPNLALSDANICDGDMAIITLSASELGVTYQLRLDIDNSPVGPALNGTGGDLNFTASTSVTTVYNVIASSGLGCVSDIIDKSTVFVMPVPEASLQLSDDEICVGNIASIILSNSVPGTSYQLRLNTDNSPVGSPAMGNGGNVFFSAAPTNTTTYNVLATNSFGCSIVISDISLVLVHPLPPQPVISVSGPTEFCDGESVVLTSSSSDGYIWNTGQVSQSILVDTSGVYSVSTIDANTCVSPASELITVTVNPLPVASISGLDIFYCLDDNPAFLIGDPSPNALSVGVFSGNGITDNTDGTAIFNPATAGTSGPHLITYTFIDENLCTDTDQQWVDVYPVPLIDFVGLNSEYCIDNSPVIITGSEAPFGSFTGAGITDLGNGTASFDPSLAGVGGPYDIIYSFTSVEGCSNTSTLQTIVYDIPLVSFSVINSEYCLDQSPIFLIGNHAPDGNFFGPGIFDHGDGTATFDPASAGVGGPYTITYEYEDANLCSNVAIQQTSVFPVPIVSFIGLGSDYCLDHAPVTIVGNHAPDGLFTGPGITDNGDGTAIFNPSAAGVGSNIEITYTYTNTFFCQANYSRFVNVHALPIVDILNLEANYCVNDGDLEIEGIPVPGPLANATFTGDGISDHGDGTATFSPSSLTAPNSYPITYTLEDENLCVGTIIRNVNMIELPDPPSADDVEVCYGQIVPDLIALGLPGYQIIWYDQLGDSVYSGNFFPTGMTEVGIYNYHVTQTHSVSGCESDPIQVSLTIRDLPTLILPPFDDLCIDDYLIFLSTGTPLGGEYSGNIGISQLADGQYVFDPAVAGVGTHNIIYTFTDTTTTCYDTAMQMIIVHDLPIVEVTGLSSVYCILGANDTIYGNHVGAGSFYGPGITDNGDGTALFSPSEAGLGNFEIIYEYIDLITGCANRDTNQVRVEDIPESVALIQISDPEYCVNTVSTVTLEAIGGSGSWVNWYQISCGGPSPDILAANADSTVIVITAPLVSTYYYAQWENSCGLSEQCADNYIVVNQLPIVPDTAWATPNIICSEDQDSVALFITGGNYGTILEWTQDSCDGVVVGQTDGNPLIIPTPDTTRFYYARWINDCGESECSDKVKVRVVRPAEEVATATADSNFFCRNTLDKIELQAFGGRGDTVIWYYDAQGLIPIPLDSILSVVSPIGDTIEIVPPTVNTIYYPFRATPCQQEGGNISVSLTVFSAPEAPISAQTIPGAICFGETDSLTLVAEGGSGITLEWYSGSCEDGVFLGNGNNFRIPPPNFTTSYFAKWTTPCGISDCVETQVEVHAPTTDPDIITTDTNQLCAGSLSDIQLVLVGGTGDSVIWFADSCGATMLDPSTFYYQSPMRDTIVISAPTTDTSFYAHWATPCENSACVAIDITVIPQPLMMDSVFSSLNNFCSGSIAEITLTALGGEGSEISWTTDSCNGPVIAVTTSNFVVIPSPQDTTTYFAKWKTICDSSECQSVQVNVTESPQDPVQISIMENLICDNVVDSITLVLEGGGGYEAVWFYGPYCGNDTIPASAINYLSEKGDTIRIARPAQPITIMANWASYQGVCGSSECVYIDVFVYEAPTAYFEISGGVECENTLLQFSPNSMPGSGLITELNWDFGDGFVVDTNLQVYQFHAYENTGDYLVQLIVTNTFGCQDTSMIPLTISEAPEAAFSYESNCLGQPIMFFDESVSAVDSIAAWFWNFNDPTSPNDTSTLQNPSYIYNQPGVYEVILTITDTTGCIGEVIQEVVISPAPTAYFSLNNASCQNDPVFFNDSSFTVNNQINTWIWNFGDGSPDTVVHYPNDPDISHIYHSSGVFTVSLKVIDSTGCTSDYFYRYFEVRSKPIAGFLYSDTACQTGIIHFFDTTYHEAGTGGVSWQWNFDDGSFAYTQNPVHSFIETGTFYNVEMIITDDYGCQDTAVTAVEVKPSMQIAFSTDRVCQGEATELVAQLIQPENDQVAEWQWFFGDNSDTIVQRDTIYHTYPSGGTFYATLIGRDEGGCETIVINQAVNVYPAPVVDYHIPIASCNDPSVFYNHSIANADSIVLYRFDYGDGIYEVFNSSNYPDPVEHVYPAGANEYNATITLTNSNGCVQEMEFLVERESCITTSFLVNLPGCIGQEVQFINNSSVNNENVELDSIIWQFGDGVIYELPIEEGDTVYHTYLIAGPINVQMKLKATNEYGPFSVNSFRNIFINETPVADFRIQEPLLCSRDSLHFKDESWVFNGEIVQWQWKFNDHYSEEDKSPLRNPSYMYSYGGDYAPNLVVVSDSGCYSSKDKSVSLHHAPINHLYSNREFGCGPENDILFKDTAYLASGNIAYYQWIFGFNDTVYSQEDSLLHQLDIGSYNVISRVVSEAGCVGMDSLSGFNVYDQPIADFGFYPEDPTIKEPEVFFNDKSRGTMVPVEYYHWDFGDGNDTIGLDPYHVYQDTGNFNVLLTIMDQNGCVDTSSMDIYVDPVYSFYMPNAFSPNGNGLNDVFGPVGAYFENTNYEFYVFSRWGELLFESYDPNIRWEGDYAKTSKKQVPLGVYSWFIRVEDALGSEHVYKGFVTVVR